MKTQKKDRGGRKPGPKTEYGGRFFNFKIGTEVMDKLDHLAAHYGKTRSDIVRHLIAERYDIVLGAVK
jgi:hypothetical protein